MSSWVENVESHRLIVEPEKLHLPQITQELKCSQRERVEQNKAVFPKQIDIEPEISSVKPVFEPLKMELSKLKTLSYNQKPTFPPKTSVNMLEKELYIKLIKLKLLEFDGDPLKWPEWSSLFLTVDSAPVDNTYKTIHLKTQVTGKK